MRIGTYLLVALFACMLGLSMNLSNYLAQHRVEVGVAYTEGSDEGYREGYTDCEVEYGHADGGAR